MSILVCLFANCLHDGWQTPLVEPYHLTLSSTADDVLNGYGGSDAGNYVKGAQEILAGTPMANSFYFNCWPPGMMALEAVLIRLVPAHFVLALFTVTVLAWSLALGYTAVVLRRLSGSRALPLILFTTFALPTFRLYLFDAGIFMSESLSIAFAIPGMLVLGEALQAGSRPKSLLAGLLLAIAALIRTQLVFAMLILLGCGLAALVWTGAGSIRRHSFPAGLKQRVIAGAMAACVYLGLVYGYAAWNKGGVVHMDYEYTMPWQVRPPGGNWEDEGGLGVLCDIDPKTCASMRAVGPQITPAQGRIAAIHTLTHRFWPFVTHKTPYMVKYFFSRTGWFPVGYSEADYVDNGAFALALLVGFFGSFAYARSFGFAYLSVLQAAVWTGTLLAPFLIMQFEVRYFYIGKAVSLIAAFMVMAELARRYRGRLSRSAPIGIAESNA